MARIVRDLEQPEEWQVVHIHNTRVGRHYLYNVALSAGVSTWNIEYETDMKPYAFFQMMKRVTQTPVSRRELYELLW